jgi:hypothetical protein
LDRSPVTIVNFVKSTQLWRNVTNLALVCVRGSLVGGAGDDGRRLAGLADLVGRIVDGESILVVAVADVTTVVLCVRAAVFDTPVTFY